MTVQECYESARNSLAKQRSIVTNAQCAANDAQYAVACAKREVEYRETVLRCEQEELARVQRTFDSWAQEIDKELAVAFGE